MKKLIFTLLCLSLAGSTYAATIIVDVNGDGQFETIQAAIDAANEGDIIEVWPGTYTGNGNRDINFLGKAITVRSTNPNEPNIVAATIIDCNGTEAEPHRGFYFHNAEDTNSILLGLTIINGYALEVTLSDPPPPFPIMAGGAIYCEQSCPTISNCTITGNSAPGYFFIDSGLGGAIACNQANPVIAQCTITDNLAGFGGAIYGGLTHFSPDISSPAISNCIIISNSSYDGGGICGCNGNITNCTIRDNSSTTFGGGLSYCDGLIDNCTIAGNTTGFRGGGMYECGGLINNCTISDNLVSLNFGAGGGIMCEDVVPSITNCTIFGNTAGEYGGGIAGCDGTISNCTISDNSANFGGGMGGCNGKIIDCNIISNSAIKYYGGGLAGCNGSINNCTISENTAEHRGGGLWRCNGPITNCNIIGNSVTFKGQGPLGSFGGGVSACDGLLSNCTISDNSAGGDGGGLGSCNGLIYNCVINDNFAQYNGGGASDCFAISNCTFSGNSASEYGGAIANDMDSYIINSILWDNRALKGNEIAIVWAEMEVEYCNVKGGEIGVYLVEHPLVGIGGKLNWGQGNIDTAPCFVDAGYWADINDVNIIVEPNDPNAVWVDGDYHLRSNSPCINAGDPNYVAEPNETDLDGQPRIFLGRVDIGVDEFVPSLEVPMHFTPQTLNPKSKGKWIKAHLVLPAGFGIEDVNTNSPARIVEPFMAESVYMDVFINEDGLVKIMAAFDRAVFCSNGSAQGNVVVIGRLTNGRYFYGTDTIRIKTNNLNYLSVLTSHWLRTDCKKPHWCEVADINQDGTVDFIDFALFDGCCLEFIKN